MKEKRDSVTCDWGFMGGVGKGKDKCKGPEAGPSTCRITEGSVVDVSEEGEEGGEDGKEGGWEDDKEPGG